MRCRIESPDAIESRALPNQSNCSEGSHDGPKEQEHAHRSEPRRLGYDGETGARLIVTVHLFNISQPPMNLREGRDAGLPGKSRKRAGFPARLANRQTETRTR